MDEFSFLSVLISVILGLAVAEILQGFRGLLWSRTRIQIYWPVIGWAVLVLLVCFQHWWSMFGMRTHHDWTVQQFGRSGDKGYLIKRGADNGKNTPSRNESRSPRVE
jgi:hypothetical protein